jgi:hypothetical protein
MAVKRELEIVIGPDGAVTVTTRGFKGATCDDAVKPLEKAFGKPVRKTRTSEYHQKEAATQKTTRS